eukprot:SAG31_NODE_17181_length_680_cov_1.024096_1_plen_117_part_10
MFFPLNGIISTIEVSSSAAAKGESISTTPEVLSIEPGQLTIRLYWPALNTAIGVRMRPARTVSYEKRAGSPCAGNDDDCPALDIVCVAVRIRGEASLDSELSLLDWLVYLVVVSFQF